MQIPPNHLSNSVHGIGQVRPATHVDDATDRYPPLPRTIANRRYEPQHNEPQQRALPARPDARVYPWARTQAEALRDVVNLAPISAQPRQAPPPGPPDAEELLSQLGIAHDEHGAVHHFPVQKLIDITVEQIFKGDHADDLHSRLTASEHEALARAGSQLRACWHVFERQLAGDAQRMQCVAPSTMLDGTSQQVTLATLGDVLARDGSLEPLRSAMVTWFAQHLAAVLRIEGQRDTSGARGQDAVRYLQHIDRLMQRSLREALAEPALAKVLNALHESA